VFGRSCDTQRHDVPLRTQAPEGVPRGGSLCRDGVRHPPGGRDLARRIDALPAGPAILGRLAATNGNALVFDLADTPNFAARLAEAGIDSSRFQTMPRLSMGLAPATAVPR
jgi:hypothetical protein